MTPVLHKNLSPTMAVVKLRLRFRISPRWRLSELLNPISFAEIEGHWKKSRLIKNQCFSHFCFFISHLDLTTISGECIMMNEVYTRTITNLAIDQSFESRDNAVSFVTIHSPEFLISYKSVVTTCGFLLVSLIGLYIENNFRRPLSINCFWYCWMICLSETCGFLLVSLKVLYIETILGDRFQSIAFDICEWFVCLKLVAFFMFLSKGCTLKQF